MKLGQSMAGWALGIVLMCGSFVVVNAIAWPAIATALTLVTILLAQRSMSDRQAAAVWAMMLGLALPLAIGATMALDQPVGWRHASFPGPREIAWPLIVGVMLGRFAVLIASAKRAKPALFLGLATSLLGACVAVVGIVQDARWPDPDGWVRAQPVIGRFEPPFSDPNVPVDAIVDALGCERWHPRWGRDFCSQGIVHRDPRGWIVLEVSRAEPIVLDAAGKRQFPSPVELPYVAPPHGWTLLAVFGLVGSGLLLRRGRRKWRAYDRLAATGQDARHLGEGRLELEGGEIIRAPRAAGLTIGPVVVEPDAKTREGAYREVRMIEGRIVEGTRAELRTTGEDLVFRFTTAAIAWTVLSCAPLATALVRLR